MIPDNCPKCHTNLIGDPIPVEDQEVFGGHTHFSRVIGIYDRDRDETVYYKCPDCGYQWAREDDRET